jgi:hypothetical protein
MNGLAVFVLLSMTQIPEVQVSTLAGDQHQGALEAFSEKAVTVKANDQSVSIPIAEVLAIRSTAALKPVATESLIDVRLVDGSRIRAKDLAATGTAATINHPELGDVRIPLSNIASVRLVPADSKVDADWNQLLDRNLKKDVLAVRKGDVLDHLDGVIGSISDAKIQFQMDGDDIEVKREKVFGLIYSKRESSAKKAMAQLDLVSGDRLALKQISWTGSSWKAKLVTGIDFEIKPELFQALDYTLGKVTYLSDLEPRTVKHVPYFDLPASYVVNEYRRDKNFDGGRISLGEKSYPKGLGLHSQTLLKYRLGGDYRRFQAIMGIGDEVPFGDVDVVIKGDDKILFKGSAKATESGEKGAIRRAVPQQLDLDVAGAVELEIFVDFGSDKRDIGDRLYLANARVVK